MDKIKSLYDRVQNLTGTAKYVAWALAGILVGIVIDFVPGPSSRPSGSFLSWVSSSAYRRRSRSERHRKHPKPPPPLGPPTRRSPF